MATCRLAAALPLTASAANANSPSSKNRAGTVAVVASRGIACNSFSQSEFFAKSGLSTAVSASVHSRTTPVAAQPLLTPICKVRVVIPRQEICGPLLCPQHILDLLPVVLDDNCFVAAVVVMVF